VLARNLFSSEASVALVPAEPVKLTGIKPMKADCICCLAPSPPINGQRRPVTCSASD